MLYKRRKSIECSAFTNNIGKQRSSVTAVIYTINGVDIELIIFGCHFSLLAINGGVARGCGIKYQNHPCPLCALEYPIG